MLSRRISRGLITVLVAIALTVPAAASDVTFRSLVQQMTDLGELARVPDPAFTCKQFSSYDRRSTDSSVLTDENWFANGDRGQHLRVEERNGATEHVMMDAPGPGAVVRFWSANANDAGIVRVYLDNAPEPAIEMPMTQMLGNDGPAPFTPPISGVRARGWNCFLPIPYASHCKITASEPSFYYQINYRTYEPGTKVETYTSALATANADLIRTAAAILAMPASVPLPAHAKRRPVAFDLADGSVATESLRGQAAIRRIAIRVEADDMEAALRGCALEIQFDDQDTPSVAAPLGDFFGAAPGFNVYESLPCGMLADGTMYSHWVMPFKKTAQVRFRNHSGAPVSISGILFTVPQRWNRGSLHFHAKWRSEYPIPTLPRQDWNYVECQGKGRFVGDMLHVTNPVKDWWGEGDEKIYVDGESFPSHFGTGTEDYYGYAWCCNEPFVHAYHNQPRCDGPGNYGQTCVNRFHIMDTIPFTKSFRFDMEAWHWKECEIAMAAVSYWYARPGGTDNVPALEPAALKVIAPTPLPEPRRVEGAIEGEALEVLSIDGGKIQIQRDMLEWSGAAQGWWIDGTPGNALTLALPAEKAGKYQLVGVFTKAIDYGIVQVWVNGKKVGKPIDLFNDGVVSTPELVLGAVDLNQGVNELKVEITGSNDKAKPKRHMVGLDYLLLKPAN